MNQSSQTTTNDSPATDRVGDLAEIIQAYTEVTENLKRSHDALSDEVIRLRKQLASTDAQLQRSRRLAALGEMAAGIAHEIRNPLAAIQLYIKMVREDVEGIADGSFDLKLLNMTRDNTLKIASEVRGLNGIVGDVLTFSRELRPAFQFCEIAGVIDRVLAMQRPHIDEKQVAVCVDVDENLAIEADYDLLTQAVVNLLRNAVDAVDSMTGAVAISATADEESVIIEVRDNGPGIDDEHVDRIFNPFYTTRSTGTGLGLAIVHRIVDAHGGAIAVRNDDGAVFELSLPRRIVAPAGERKGGETIEERTETETAQMIGAGG